MTTQPIQTNAHGSALAGAQADFDIEALMEGGLPAGRFACLNFTGAATTLSGIVSPTGSDDSENGPEVAGDQPSYAVLLSHPNGCTLAAENVGSVAQNRIAAGGPAVVKQALLVYDSTISRWRVMASVGAASSGIVNADVSATAGIVLTKLAQGTQAGASTLIAGAVTVATATITATSRILVTMQTPLGVLTLTVGYIARLSARVVGAPGSFTIEAVLADGTIDAANLSILDWLVVN